MSREYSIAFHCNANDPTGVNFMKLDDGVNVMSEAVEVFIHEVNREIDKIISDKVIEYAKRDIRYRCYFLDPDVADKIIALGIREYIRQKEWEE